MGQVAGRDITNYVSFSEVLEAAEARLEEIVPDPELTYLQHDLAASWRGYG